MVSCYQSIFLATALSLTMMGAASAQMARFRIEDRLPDELKGRVATMMRSERPKDAEAALTAAKVKDGLLWRKFGVLLLRVETGCEGDICMVMIGKVKDQAFIPQLMLRAGPTVTGGDEVTNLWGVNSSQFTFEGREGAKINVWSRGDNWVADAGGTCFSASAPNPKLDLLPPPSVKSPTEP